MAQQKCSAATPSLLGTASQVFRKLLAFLSSAVLASAKSLSCQPPFSLPVSPSLVSYLAGLQTSLNAVQEQIARLPQPKIQFDGQDVYAVAGQMYAGVGVSCTVYYPGGVMPADPCPYDNYTVLEAALNYLAAAGVTTVDVNVGVLPLANSLEYEDWWTYGPGYTWGSTPLIALDCGGGAGPALTFVPGMQTVVPSGSGPWCKTLAVWDDIINYAQTNFSPPLKIRLAPTPSTEQSQCNFSTHSLEQCYGPLYYAAVKRWGAAIDSLTVIHEPSTGGVWGMNSLATINVATVRGLIQWCYPVIHLANPSTAVGAAAVTSLTASQEVGYWNDWLTNLVPPGSCGSTTCMDYFGLDVYPMTWDVSVYGSVGGQFMCGANNQTASISPCYLTPVLSPCTPATTDTPNDCQWFIPSSTGSPSGDVLSGVTGGAAGVSGVNPPASGTGSCTYAVTGGGPVAQGGVLLIGYSGGAVTTVTVINIGGGYASAPSHASRTSGSCTGATITLLSWGPGNLANFANGGALNLASSLAASALAIQEPVRVNESNRPVFVPANCTPQGGNGIFDNDYVEWAQDGMDTAWFSTIASWASANGFSSVSPFATQMWAWYNSVDVNAVPPCSLPYGSNNCPAPFPYQLPYLNQVSISGSYWAWASKWVSSSIQGNSMLTGKSELH